MNTRTRIISLIFCLIFLSLGFSLAQAQEEISIITHYPSPAGVYGELRARNMAIGDDFVNNYSLYCWLVGGCGQVIATDTNLVVNGNVGIGTRSTEFKLTLDNDLSGPGMLADGGIIAKGTFGSGATLSTSGAGTRFIWYPRKAALRAGIVTMNQWDDVNIGDYSIAFGYNNTASGLCSTAASGLWNTASGQYSTVVGGIGNTTNADYATATAGGINRAWGQYSVVAGGGWQNQATNSWAAIAGGSFNSASGQYSAVGGGQFNLATADYSAIAGGSNNSASSNYATVAGGFSNSAAGQYAAIAGGNDNSASGSYATVAGGEMNSAGGNYSWVGGKYMQLSASADYTFVWGYADAPQTINSQRGFLIFPAGATGKVGINKVNPAYEVDVVGSVRVGDCFWGVSDERFKTRVQSIKQALKKIAKVQGISFRHKYAKKSQVRPEKRQIGIIAQELEKVFPELVSTSKEDGYKSAAYDRLNAVILEAVKELDAEFSQLEQRVSALENKK